MASQTRNPETAGLERADLFAQPKAAACNKPLVGGYIFLAGLSGAAAMLAGIADRRARPSAERAAAAAVLATTIGPVLLIGDLRTPKHFYNMRRIARATSPISIAHGIWRVLAGSRG